MSRFSDQTVSGWFAQPTIDPMVAPLLGDVKCSTRMSASYTSGLRESVSSPSGLVRISWELMRVG